VSDAICTRFVPAGAGAAALRAGMTTLGPSLIEAGLGVGRVVSRGAVGARGATVLCGARGPRTGSPWTPPAPRTTICRYRGRSPGSCSSPPWAVRFTSVEQLWPPAIVPAPSRADDTAVLSVHQSRTGLVGNVTSGTRTGDVELHHCVNWDGNALGPLTLLIHIKCRLLCDIAVVQVDDVVTEVAIEVISTRSAG
jgi:hypothetical protein